MKQQCVFCLISSGRVPSKKVYEDEKFIAILDIYPASKGHTILFTKEHIQNISELPDEIFSVAKMIIKSLKELSPNINFFIAEGKLAGQKAEHIVIHLIPRYENDNIPLTWNPSKIEEKELEELHNKIASNIIPSKKEEPKPEIEESVKEEKEENIEESIPKRNEMP